MLLKLKKIWYKVKFFFEGMPAQKFLICVIASILIAGLVASSLLVFQVKNELASYQATQNINNQTLFQVSEQNYINVSSNESAHYQELKGLYNSLRDKYNELPDDYVDPDLFNYYCSLWESYAGDLDQFKDWFDITTEPIIHVEVWGELKLSAGSKLMVGCISFTIINPAPNAISIELFLKIKSNSYMPPVESAILKGNQGVWWVPTQEGSNYFGLFSTPFVVEGHKQTFVFNLEMRFGTTYQYDITFQPVYSIINY